MTPSETLNDGPVRRVSVLGRLVPAFSYGVAAPACAVSAVLLFGLLRALKPAEIASVAAVAGGMAEATLPTALALYFACAVGVIAVLVAIIRLFTTNTTASPSALFFLIAGFVGLLPLALLWEAESVFIAAVTQAPGGGGLLRWDSTINRWLMLTIVFGVISDVILVIGSLIPLPAIMRARRDYAALVVLLLMEAALIGMAVAFQTRLAWLQGVRFTGRF
jgi:hypothetical protein